MEVSHDRDIEISGWDLYEEEMCQRILYGVSMVFQAPAALTALSSRLDHGTADAVR